jgi:hypothetical protein
VGLLSNRDKLTIGVNPTIRTDVPIPQSFQRLTDLADFSFLDSELHLSHMEDAMEPTQFTRSAARWFAGGVGVAAVSYATYVAAVWFRYRRATPAGDPADSLLDQFMTEYEVGGRHKICVAAPAEVTFSAASELDLESCALVRVILKARERILRSEPGPTTKRPLGLLAHTKSLGWGVLAERPGREIVMGCATKPWEANPVFRTLRPDEFATFDEPGYVKIVWTLRADPAGVGRSVFRTETRAIATDAEARKRFRRYWALVSPGIILIRVALLPAVKAEAERRRHEIAA